MRTTTLATSLTSNCPACGTHFTRIRRRPIDRALSAIVPLYRVRCDNATCQWEGNVRSPRLAMTSATPA